MTTHLTTERTMESTVPTTLPATTIPRLLEAFAAVPDPRRAGSITYPLPAILALAVSALVCAHTSVLAIAEWGERQPQDLLERPGFTSGQTPCQSTLQRLFAKLDAQALATALGVTVDDPGPHTRGAEGVAIDGKAQRGRRQFDESEHTVHILSAFSHERNLVLAEEPITDHGDKAAAELAVAPRWPIENRSHRAKDVNFGEDASLIHHAQGPVSAVSCAMRPSTSFGGWSYSHCLGHADLCAACRSRRRPCPLARSRISPRPRLCRRVVPVNKVRTGHRAAGLVLTQAVPRNLCGVWQCGGLAMWWSSWTPWSTSPRSSARCCGCGQGLRTADTIASGRSP